MSNETLTDRTRELMKDIRNGHEEALRELYAMTHRKVYFYLYRILNDKETAEDVLVETFTQVWKSARNYEGRSQPQTWMFGIARNIAMNELRKRKDHDDIDDHPHLAGGSMPEAEVSNRKKILMDALSKVSPKHREILDLVFFHDMDYQEISELLNIPVSTVKTRVFYSKDALKNTLLQMGVTKDVI